MLVLYLLLRVYLNDVRQNNLPPDKIKMEASVPVTITGFKLYYDKSKGIEVLFPKQPEVTNFEVLGYPSTHYQAAAVVDEHNFAQYSVTYTDSEIYSTESINAYLNNSINGKIIGLGGGAKVVTSEVTKYKGFPAREYLIEYTIEGVLINNKGINFIMSGDPISLSVSYPATMSEVKTHFREFTKSFILK